LHYRACAQGALGNPLKTPKEYEEETGQGERTLLHGVQLFQGVLEGKPVSHEWAWSLQTGDSRGVMNRGPQTIGSAVESFTILSTRIKFQKGKILYSKH